MRYIGLTVLCIALMIMGCSRKEIADAPSPTETLMEVVPADTADTMDIAEPTGMADIENTDVVLEPFTFLGGEALIEVKADFPLSLKVRLVRPLDWIEGDGFYNGFFSADIETLNGRAVTHTPHVNVDIVGDEIICHLLFDDWFKIIPLKDGHLLRFFTRDVAHLTAALVVILRKPNGETIESEPIFL